MGCSLPGSFSRESSQPRDQTQWLIFWTEIPVKLFQIVANNKRTVAEIHRQTSYPCPYTWILFSWKVQFLPQNFCTCSSFCPEPSLSLLYSPSDFTPVSEQTSLYEMLSLTLCLKEKPYLSLFLYSAPSDRYFYVLFSGSSYWNVSPMRKGLYLVLLITLLQTS